MKPSWILSILLAMVGTGFGQDCFVGASKGIPTCDEGGLCRCLLSEGHNSKAPTTVELEPLGKEYQGGMIYYASGPLCRLKKGGGLACLDDDGNLMPEWTMSGGDQPKASFAIHTDDPVDVPAIPAFTKDQLRIRADAGLSGEQQWNCADENRALLTSVNGKRHSCHLIQGGRINSMDLPISPTAGIRNHPSNWTKEPEKASTHCLYCKRAVPDHTAKCVVPQRTVVVEFKTRMVIAMPRSFDEEAINFSMNDSSACMSRYVEQLAKESDQEEGICHICSRSEMKYLGEATDEDHGNLSYLIQEGK